MPVGVGTPVNTAVHLLGPYHVPNYDVSITIVATKLRMNFLRNGDSPNRSPRARQFPQASPVPTQI